MAVAHHAGARPTRARWVVVLFGVTLAFITYVDRACIGQAAPAIRREFNLTAAQMGYVFSVFGIAYALFEIPSGWLVDRIGPRKVLMRIVVWWSFFTAATGWVWNLPSLLVTRFLFGAGEAGCFPGLAKSFSTWLPRHERPLAEGLKAASARWGAAVTPFVVVLLMQAVSWREVFVFFGAIGIVWAMFFYWWYRDNPRAHSGVNAAELALIPSAADSGHAAIPWRRFVTSRNVWLLWIQWFCHFYGFYFYITWLPTYLQQGRGLEIRSGALLAGLPLLAAGAGSLFCGLISPVMDRWTGSIARTRRVLACVAFGGAAALLLLSVQVRDPIAAMFVMSASSFIAELGGPISWTTCMDLGGPAIGSLSASMNMVGQIGGSVAPTLIGWILQWTGNNWSLAFYVSAGIYALGAVCWMFLDPVTPVDGNVGTV